MGVKRRPFWLKELSPEAFGYFFAPKACLGASVVCNGFANVFTNAFGQLFFAAIAWKGQMRLEKRKRK